jgi:hypothetical protein
VRARYTPDWGQDDGGEELIGAVGPLDIYYEFRHDIGECSALVVGPPERLFRQQSQSNFDVYTIVDKSRLEGYPHHNFDVHIELHEMCELYALLVEKGYITLDTWRSSDAGK